LLHSICDFSEGGLGDCAFGEVGLADFGHISGRIVKVFYPTGLALKANTGRGLYP
jgi:hypothetical protein